MHRVLNADLTPYLGSITLLERRPVGTVPKKLDVKKLEKAIKEMEKKCFTLKS